MADDTQSERSAQTFSSIRTPSLSMQQAAMKAMPKLKSPNKKASKLRRIPAADTDIYHTFTKVFKKNEFRGQQEAIMKAAVKGLDIMVVAPTGLGKSLCFQVPAVADKHGVTIVVSPLISLMQNQVEVLLKLKVRAAMLVANTPANETKKIMRDLSAGHPKTRLLYVTPERIATPSFQKKLMTCYRQNELARFCIDESHCISEWGQTFRKAYANLGLLRTMFPKVPIMALTASATETVVENIIDSLNLDPDYLFQVTHPFNRANLFYEVRYIKDGPDDRLKDIADFIQKLYRRKPDSGEESRAITGIIYCRAKSNCDAVAAFLKTKGINAAAYHRGLKNDSAKKAQDRWMYNDLLAEKGKPRIDCIVATIAFGMGIDKDNVRYVIHYDLPKSFEGYYQETGRAGRDGHASRVLLYYSAADELRVSYFATKSAEQLAKDENVPDKTLKQHAKHSVGELMKFVKNSTVCRHVSICRYFGEAVEQGDAKRLCQKMCDVCKTPQKVVEGASGISNEEFSPQATQRIMAEGADQFEEADRAVVMPPIQEELSDSESDSFGQNVAAAEDLDLSDMEEAMRSPARPEPPVAGPSKITIKKAAPSKAKANRFAATKSDDEFELPSISQATAPILATYRTGTAFKAPSMVSKSKCKEKAVQEVDFSDEDDTPLALPKSRPAKKATVDKPISKKRKAEETVQPSEDDEIVALSQFPPTALGKSAKKAKAAFKAPFKENADPRQVNRLKPPSQATSSEHPSPPNKFKLVPGETIYSKPILADVRHQAVVSLDKHLCQALLSRYGVRKKKQEEAIFALLDLKGLDHAEKRSIILQTATDIESDCFWAILTASGYKDALLKTTSNVEALTQDSAWFQAAEINLEVGCPGFAPSQALIRTANRYNQSKEDEREHEMSDDL